MGKKLNEIEPEQLDWGKRLRLTRVALGMPQTRLARLAGIGKTTLANYEAGIRVPESIVGPNSDAAMICKTLGVTMDWLFRGDSTFLSQHVVERLRDYGWDVRKGAPPPVKIAARGARSRPKVKKR